MRKVKVFNESASTLERKINDWIEECEIDVISINHTRENGYATVIVLYDEYTEESGYDDNDMSLDEINDELDDAIVEGDDWHRNLNPGWEQQAFAIKKQMDDEFAKRKGLNLTDALEDL